MRLVVMGGQEDLLASSKHFGGRNFGGAGSNTVDTLGNFNCQALISMRLCCLFYNLGPAELNTG